MLTPYPGDVHRGHRHPRPVGTAVLGADVADHGGEPCRTAGRRSGDAELGRCRKAIGDEALPVIRLHDLRHTHATLLLAKGVPVKVVSERLGHASATITLQVYAHVMPGNQRDAAELFASLVKGGMHDEFGMSRALSASARAPGAAAVPRKRR